MTFRRALASLILFGISFGYVEASVVVYLRHVYDPIRREVHPQHPPDELFPLITTEQLTKAGPQHQRLLATELGRELATLIMLAGAAVAVASTPLQWFAAFAIAFGIWDLAFYLFLKIILNWPASWLTWDILFLLPAPWVGPVLAPVLVSIAMIWAGIVVLRCELNGQKLAPNWKHWCVTLGGAVVLMIAFMWDVPNTLAGNWPNPFNWPLFAVGLLMGIAAVIHALRKAKLTT